jgi:formate C-acetyltransferase
MSVSAWEGFTGGQWQKDIDTAVFVRLNYTPYEDGPEFLAPATPATESLWGKL